MSDAALLSHWDKQKHVIDADPNGDRDWTVELKYKPEWRQLLIAELDYRPIGFIQVIDPEKEETQYWGKAGSGIRAIDVRIGESSDLGKGYGTLMMKEAIAQCFDNDAVDTILIDPLETNDRARKFYERMGFKFVENRRFNEDNCAVYRMMRNEWENIKKQ